MLSFFRSKGSGQVDRLATLDEAMTVEDVVLALRSGARSIAGADGITVIRRDGDMVTYVDEDSISPLWKGQSFPIRMCISGMAILGREPILIPDILHDKRVPLNAYLSTFVRSMAMFPIGQGDPKMAMGAYWRDARPIDAGAVERLGMLADQAGDAIARVS